MGWTISFASDSPIKKEVVGAVVEAMPATLQGPYQGRFMGWGWLSGVDVWLPDNTRIRIGGSGATPGSLADKYAAEFQSRMREKGCHLLRLP